MNYAFYKESGKPWTIEEVKHIQQSFISQYSPYPTYEGDSALHRKWIMYANDNKSGYYMWYRQDKADNFGTLTPISYEQWLKGPTLKTYKVKDFDA